MKKNANNNKKDRIIALALAQKDLQDISAGHEPILGGTCSNDVDCD
jgi:hypothetical protein